MLRLARILTMGWLVMMLQAAGPAQAQGEDHKQLRSLALELIRMTKIDASIGQIENVVMAQMDAMLRQNPKIDDDAIRIVQEIVSSEIDALRAPMMNLSVNLMMQYYDEKDLKALIDFYRTPTGQKSIQLMPKMMGDITVANMKMMQKMQPRLQRRIKEALQNRGYQN